MVSRRTLYLTAGAALIASVQAAALYPLHRTADLPLWDEAVNMSAGERFLLEGSLDALTDSPFLAALYAGAVFVAGRAGAVFLMAYASKVAASVLLYLFLARRADALWALPLTLLWVCSPVNLYEAVSVYHVALAVFVAGLLCYEEEPAAALAWFALAALTRFEYVFPAVPFGAYLLWRRGKLRWKRAAVLVPLALAFVVSCGVSDWNPGGNRMWFAFNQNYARRQVEAGRFRLDPMIDYNVVVGHDFPRADSLRSAVLTEPERVAAHVWRNVLAEPRAVLAFLWPSRNSHSLWPKLLLFLLAGLGLARGRPRPGRTALLAAFSVPALLPILLVYPLPHHALVAVPFLLCLLGRGLGAQNAVPPRPAAIALSVMLVGSLAMAGRPYLDGGGRPLRGNVARAEEVWPSGRVRLLGLNATTYCAYLGRERCVALEPFGMAKGSPLPDSSPDLARLLESRDPDGVLVTPEWEASRNFDPATMRVLDEGWARYDLSAATLYIRER